MSNQRAGKTHSASANDNTGMGMLLFFKNAYQSLTEAGYEDEAFYFEQVVDHLRVDVAWPGPATEVVDAALVDGDDGDALTRSALAAPHSDIVGEALEGFAGADWQPGSGSEDQADDQGYRPIGRKSSFFHRLLTCRRR